MLLEWLRLRMHWKPNYILCHCSLGQPHLSNSAATPNFKSEKGGSTFCRTPDHLQLQIHAGPLTSAGLQLQDLLKLCGFASDEVLSSKHSVKTIVFSKRWIYFLTWLLSIDCHKEKKNCVKIIEFLNEKLRKVICNLVTIHQSSGVQA